MTDVTDLLRDCHQAMTDPSIAMEHWGPYWHLLTFKLTHQVPPQTRPVVDEVLRRLREQLEAHTRRQLGLWELARHGEVPNRRLKKGDPLHAMLGEISGHAGEVLYHGTVQGRLAPIYLRGLRTELRPFWPERSPAAFELVANWREAEVHAAMAHLRAPRARLLPYWIPVVLRVPLDRTYVEKGLVRVAAGHVLVRDPLPAQGVEVWPLGAKGLRPHWRPLGHCLNRGPLT